MSEEKSVAEIMDEAVRLNKELGFKTIIFEPGKSAVKVVSTPLHENHLGSIHAGVLFTLAEYTSGSTLLGLILNDMDKIFSVVKLGKIEFLAPAKNAVIAYGEVPVDLIIQAKNDVLNGIKVDIPVEIIIKNESDQKIVAKCTFDWALRKIKQ